MTFRKVVVINASGHLLGRLASVVAKELLKGQHVVCVKCENINISGSLHRNKLKYKAFLRLRMNSNPRRGPFHLRAPSRIFWRVVRGMIKHKTIRGKKALSRLEVHEGVPIKYERKKKVVVPAALRAIRLKPGRNFCRLGELSEQVGWSKGDLISRLEEKRKARALTYFKKQQALKKATESAKVAAGKTLPQDSLQLLKQCGYA